MSRFSAGVAGFGGRYRVLSAGVWYRQWDLATPPPPDLVGYLAVHRCGQRSTPPLEGL